MSELERDTVKLHIEVVDPEVVSELLKHDEGHERELFSLSALRLGVLAMRQARGELDAATIREAGERLLAEVRETLTSHAGDMARSVAGSLRDYLDPTTGVLQHRLERLVGNKGELDLVLGRYLDDTGALARTLAQHVGTQSPLFRLLSPEEATSVLGTLEREIGRMLDQQRDQLRQELSLDHQDSALSRLVAAMTTTNGKLREEFARNVDQVVTQLSLDRPDSALSRLVTQVTHAQEGITRQFSLDDSKSSLSRLRATLLDTLTQMQTRQDHLHTEIRETLATLQARKQEAARSTRHGETFEGAVCDLLAAELTRLGDVAKPCGTTAGQIKHCKVGDFVAELGPDSAAPGERIVIEAKASSAYDLPKALAEIKTARENRDAQVGVFVFKKSHAPSGTDILVRFGQDIVTVWDPDDTATDIYLKTAYSLARHMVVSRARTATEATFDFEALDAALSEINRQAESLDEIMKSGQTITGAADKITNRVRLVKKSLLEKLGDLNEHVNALRAQLGSSTSRSH